MIRTLRYFLPLLLRQRAMILATLVLSLITMAAGIGLLGLSGWFITAAAVAGSGALFNIIGPSAGVRGLSFIRILGRYGERYSGHATTLGIVAQTRGWLFGRLLRQAPLPRDITRSDAVSRLVTDLDLLDNLFLTVLGPVTTSILTALLMGIGLALILPGAAVVYVTLFLIACAAVPAWLLRRAREPAAGLVAAVAQLRAGLLDGLDGHRDLVAFGQTARLVEGAQAGSAALAAARNALGSLTALAALLVQLLTGAALVWVLVAGLDAFAAGRIDGPLLAGLVLAVLASFEASQALTRSIARFAASLAAAARVIDLAERPSEAEVSAPMMPARTGRLELRGVSFAYPGVRPILSGLDLEVMPGERVAIIGPSGSGKTALAKLLVRLETSQAGDYLLDGADTRHMDPAEVRRRVALMTQDAPLFNVSVRDNLTMAAPGADDARLWAALAEAGVDGEVRQAGGLDVSPGEAGARLSTGQIRRIALARTLLTGADIFVLDEPTSGLDMAAENRFFATLAKVARGRTLIAITHSQTLGDFDRVLELRAGRLAAR